MPSSRIALLQVCLVLAVLVTLGSTCGIPTQDQARLMMNRLMGLYSSPYGQNQNPYGGNMSPYGMNGMSPYSNQMGYGGQSSYPNGYNQQGYSNGMNNGQTLPNGQGGYNQGGYNQGGYSNGQTYPNQQGGFVG